MINFNLLFSISHFSPFPSSKGPARKKKKKVVKINYEEFEQF